MNTDVHAPRCQRTVWQPGIASEEGVARVEPRWWEECYIVAGVQCLDLLLVTADRCRGADDLGSYSYRPPAVGTELLDNGLVQADHRAERPGDEVQLVLNDKTRWGRDPFALQPEAEQSA